MTEKQQLKFETVKSSNLAGVHYDKEAKKLTVKFANGGTYSYDGVNPEQYKGLLAAESAGSYFHKHIRNGDFKFTKLQPENPTDEAIQDAKS